MSQLLEITAHSTVEIPSGEWKILRDLYVERRNESTGYSCINNFIHWIAKDPSIDIKCYTLDDSDWRTDGTHLFIWKFPHNQHVFFNTLSESLERLTALLLCLTSNKILFNGYGERLMPAVDAFRKHFAEAPMSTNSTVWYRANKELVVAFTADAPAGLEFKNLKLEDAETINEIWPHRAPGSIHFVRTLIAHNVSVGAYDANGELIAWCLRLPLGSLGILQVRDTHKRLGLGSLMVRYLSKKISELGEEVLAPVVPVNMASRSMFEKLGFQSIDKVYWTF
ncbi:uncharacterized protein LOC108608432 [Drosophila busckii]|uniref:uncharacterized protein LOC108608432 n=1 Tax=Drosophila busckii TaxID=30019 RepID=UPI00083F0BCB|nr:uncharacterized protein LOC108608432 [Drosophila busckii]